MLHQTTPGATTRRVRIDPFTMFVPDTELDDLRERIARTRWPEVVNGVSAHQAPSR